MPVEPEDSVLTEVLPSVAQLRGSEVARTERMVRPGDEPEAGDDAVLVDTLAPRERAHLPPRRRRRVVEPALGVLVGGALGTVVLLALVTVAVLLAL